MSESDESVRAEQLERSLAGKVSWGLPAATVVAAIGVGIGFGVGPAILVLAAGALVGVIGLLWASLRTLGGDAPLAEGLATAAAMRGGVSHVAERKRRVLRALKDLELEHSVGKLDDEDYAEISASYREQAKGILREMDVEIEPIRPKAEALARRHLEKMGIATTGHVKGEAPSEPDGSTGESSVDELGKVPMSATPISAKPMSARVECARCKASNELDAAFCKKCRARLSRVECPSCATSNEPDATFCKKCGVSLAGEAGESKPLLSEAKDA